jgi:AcrR family transcriptional regulator
MGPEHQVFEAALTIVRRDGFAALTMHAVADELGCGIGTIYKCVRSKEELVAHLQRQSLTVVDTAFTGVQVSLDLLDEREPIAPATLALARALASAELWSSVDARFPVDAELLRWLFSGNRVDPDAMAVVAPEAFAFLARVGELIDQAHDDGALDEGVGLRRATILLSALSGVAMTVRSGHLGQHDVADMLRQLGRGLFLGWGADPDQLTAAQELVRGVLPTEQPVGERRPASIAVAS